MFELFTPDTTIFFAYTGIDDHNKTVHDKIPDFVTFARGRMKGTEMQKCSFQRVDQGYAIAVPKANITYELLMYCDTVVFYNGGPGGMQQWVGIIDNVAWRNPGCYYVYFHIDWYTSTLGMVDYEQTWAYIEREHVEKDWNGNNPEFSNMGVDEGFSTEPDTPINTELIKYTFDRKHVYVFSPYTEDAKPNFDGQMENGIYTALIRDEMSVQQCNEYLKKIADSDTADLNNIVAIVSKPDQFGGFGGQLMEKTEIFDMPWIKHVESVPVFNNSKCWSGEFCRIKLSSGTGQSITVNTQWFGSNRSNFRVRETAFLNGGDGGIIATLINENQTFEGSNGNGIACYGDFSVALTGLPQSPWVGNEYAQWKAANMTGYMMQNIGSLIGSTNKMLSGYASRMQNPTGDLYSDTISSGVQFGSDLLVQAGDIARTIGNAKTSGTVVGGSANGDINTAAALNKYGFQIVMYMCQSYIMKSVDSFFDRFGYKVNKLKLLNRKARPRWTYIKTHEVHLESDTGISMVARSYIQSILNSGVTFWRDPEKIGDYSSPEGNKGV